MKIQTRSAQPVALKENQREPKVPMGIPLILAVSAVGLTAAFGWPLVKLFRFALQSDLYSYILLVPLVSGYLFVAGPKISQSVSVGKNRRSGVALLCSGVAILAVACLGPFGNDKVSEQDFLAFVTLSYVLLLSGLFALLANRSNFRKASFPLAFLLFMVPFPWGVEQAIENFLQHGSAPPAFWLFHAAGTPVFKQDMVFQLPGITLQIAPECSGIRSTLVLFMTSLLTGHLFLRSPWKRVFLALFVIPLALARNGLRVFTIGELCVHVGPHMIDSDIHHKGGPIFFALSLIPFFLVVVFLVRSDRSKNRVLPSSHQT